jgi:hypothetical protein
MTLCISDETWVPLILIPIAVQVYFIPWKCAYIFLYDEPLWRNFEKFDSRVMLSFIAGRYGSEMKFTCQSWCRSLVSNYVKLHEVRKMKCAGRLTPLPYYALLSYTKVAVTRLHASRPLKNFTPPPPTYRPALSHQYSVASVASSELSSLAWAPLFALQRCTVLMRPWSLQFGDGCCNFKELTVNASSIYRYMANVWNAPWLNAEAGWIDRGFWLLLGSLFIYVSCGLKWPYPIGIWAKCRYEYDGDSTDPLRCWRYDHPLIMHTYLRIWQVGVSVTRNRL